MPRRRKPRLPRALRLAAFAVLALLGVSLLLTLPLRFVAPATTAFMLQDASGRDPVAWQWRDWPSLGEHLPIAAVASEDQKFSEHFGFDVAAIRDSVEDAERGRRLRGASTISQQLAKNLYLWPGRSFLRKGLEAWLTVFLELGLPKRRILEIYLNVAEFGPGVYGAEAAARHFFGKPAAALSAREAALLVAVLPNPHRYNAGRPTPYLRERQAWILGQVARLRREGWYRTLD